MSIEGRRWARQVAKRTELLPRAKVVAFVLAERHNGKTGQCTPGQDTIARDAGMPQTTTKRGIGDLREAKLIEVRSRQKRSGRGRTSDSYSLTPVDGVAPRRWDQQTASGTLVSDQDAPSVRPTDHESTTNRPPVSDQQTASGPEPRREPRSEQGREPRSTEIALPSLTQQNGNGRLGEEEGEAEPQAVPADVDVEDQPAPRAPLLAQVKPTERQEAYIAGWCQEHGIDEEWYPDSKQEASEVIAAMEEAKRSRKAEAMVARLVRQKVAA